MLIKSLGLVSKLVTTTYNAISTALFIKNSVAPEVEKLINPAEPTPIKRKPGRPRKNGQSVQIKSKRSRSELIGPKRKSGRPRTITPVTPVNTTAKGNSND